MKKQIRIFSFAAVPDSIKAMVADFDSIVQVAEKDYAAIWRDND